MEKPAYVRRPNPNDSQFNTTEGLTDREWTDGKPIYSTVYEFGAYPNATAKTLGHDVSGGMEKVVDIRSVGVDTSTGNSVFAARPDPTGVVNNLELRVDDDNGGNIAIASGADWSAYSGDILILYTKP